MRPFLRSLRKTYRRWKGASPPIVACTAELQAVLETLGPGDIAVDCGANIGEVTEVLAWRGATVHAFEPNPHAFYALKHRFRFRRNVVCHQKAVSTQDGSVSLFMHRQSDENPLYWSTGSSLLAEKGNVDSSRPVTVNAIDLTRFIRLLPGPVTVLKLDVEGAEVDILESLINDAATLEKVRHVLVETHDGKIPSLIEPMRVLRERIAKQGLEKIRLDWH